MSSYETGYAKNAANFKDLIIRVDSLKQDYDPPKQALALQELQAQLFKAEQLAAILYKALPKYSKSVDEQELTFKPLANLITRSFNYLKVAIVNPAELETIKTLADKIRGIVKKTKATAENGVSHSQAQTSYDNKLENYKKYIEALENTNVYAPKESDLTLDYLKSLISNLENTIITVALAKTPLDAARKDRFNLFYTPQTGLIDIALMVKTYVKAILPKNHPQYKAIQTIKFTRKTA